MKGFKVIVKYHKSKVKQATNKKWKAHKVEPTFKTPMPWSMWILACGQKMFGWLR